MNTSRFLSIPAEEYHSASRRGRQMSSHPLAAIRESPELYRRKTSGKIVSSKDFGFIVKLQKSVWLHTAVSALLDDGLPKATVRAEYCGVPCQMHMDWFSEKHGLVDLKTCDSLKWFEGDCKRFGYVFQMAFYRAVLREATGETAPVHLIAVEKNEPFSTGVWEMPGDVLDQAEKVNEAALARYRKCLQTGEWPTGYEETRVITSL